MSKERVEHLRSVLEEIASKAQALIKDEDDMSRGQIVCDVRGLRDLAEQAIASDDKSRIIGEVVNGR